MIAMSMEEDMGYLKGRMEDILVALHLGDSRMTNIEKRLVKLEKYAFALIMLGPVILGFLAFFKETILKLFQ